LTIGLCVSASFSAVINILAFNGVTVSKEAFSLEDKILNHFK
jgi:hypothetical protein